MWSWSKYTIIFRRKCNKVIKQSYIGIKFYFATHNTKNKILSLNILFVGYICIKTEFETNLKFYFAIYDTILEA
jgi:hypothetical protein